MWFVALIVAALLIAGVIHFTAVAVGVLAILVLLSP